MMRDFSNHFLSTELSEPHSSEWQAKRRIGDAIRSLTEVLLTSSPDPTKMDLIAAELEKTTSQLAKAPRTYGRANWAASDEHGSWGQINHEISPLSGQSNPIAPPLTHSIHNGRAYGSCHCGWAYEGPPNKVHGGYIAAILDEFLGYAQVLGKRPGLTSSLEINYHAPTPIDTDLKLEGWVEKVEGRKTFLCGELSAGGLVTASGKALFIQPRNIPKLAGLDK